MDKPKFKRGEQVVYHAGNWKWLVLDVLKTLKGNYAYFLLCNDESCECSHDDDIHHNELMDEEDLISYDEWCEHTDKGTCKTCCN